MRIGIDARPLEGKRSGTGRYIFEVCKTLHEIGGKHEYFLYAKGPFEMPVDAPNWHARVEPDARFRNLMSLVWLKLRGGKLASEDALDSYWGTISFFPKLDRSIRRVITICDITHELFPHTMARQTLIGYRLFFRNELHSADAISVISKGTAQRIYDHYGVKAKAIVHPPIAELFSSSKRKPESFSHERLANLGILGPYVLAVGTAEPRKNLVSLINAFRELVKEDRFSHYTLVLVGAKGWRDGKLARILEREKGRVLQLGYLSDEDLLCVYRGATLFVFPSLYEGYGIPLNEALLCGVPAIATDSPEIREAGGDACLYVKPDADSIRISLAAALAEGLKVGEAPKYDKRAEVACLLSLLEGKQCG